MKLMRTAVLMTAALGLAAPANAEWLEAKTTHFTIYGDVSPKTMAQFAGNLARFDAAIRKVLPPSPGDQTGGSDRLTIFVVDSVDSVQRLAGRGSTGVAGFYHANAYGAFAVTPRTTDNAKFTQQVLFHEYVHHVTLGSSRGYYPAWMAEGMAEFLGTARIMPDDSVRIGIPNNVRAWAILMDSPMPVATLLSGQWGGSEVAYGRAWLLIHYLVLGGGYGKGLNDYVALINQGVPQSEAATKAFGDLTKMNTALNSYRLRSLPAADIPAAALKVDPVTIRQLDAGESAIMPLRFRSAIGVSDKDAKALAGSARRIAAKYPQHGWVQRVLAEIEFDAGNDDAAEAAADAAIAIRHDDVDALLYKGQVHVRRLVAKKDATPAEWREARSWFLKANKIDPNLAMPFVLFYNSFKQAGETPSPNALAGLQLAAALVPQDDSLRLALTMAMIDKGDMKGAAAVLRPLAYRPHGGGEDSSASKLLKLLDSGADAATIKAQLAASGKKTDEGEKP